MNIWVPGSNLPLATCLAPSLSCFSTPNGVHYCKTNFHTCFLCIWPLLTTCTPTSKDIFANVKLIARILCFTYCLEMVWLISHTLHSGFTHITELGLYSKKGNTEPQLQQLPLGRTLGEVSKRPMKTGRKDFILNHSRGYV